MKENNKLLFDNQYFPCVNWFNNSINEKYIKMNTSVRYKKHSFHNRCVVAGSTGLIFLSVPLEGGRDKNQKQQLRNVKISYAENWPRKHLKTIESCYRNAPYFDFYIEELLEFFDTKFEYLYDFNERIIERINQLIFKNQIDISGSDNFNIVGDERVISYYPDSFQAVETSPVYYQLFQDKIGFQPNISILDLLFMEGPNAVNLLLSNNSTC